MLLHRNIILFILLFFVTETIVPDYAVAQKHRSSSSKKKSSKSRKTKSGKKSKKSYQSKKYSQKTSIGGCGATTKKGTSCKRSASSGGYCWQHGGGKSGDDTVAKSTVTNEKVTTKTYSGGCEAITTKGTRCKRKAKDSFKYCWQHAASNEEVELEKEEKGSDSQETDESETSEE